MASRKNQPPRKRPTPPQPIREVSISFGPQELGFLVQALRDLPVQGTPDNLAQILPLIQGVRLKFATALQVAAGGAPPPPTPETLAEEETPTPPAE